MSVSERCCTLRLPVCWRRKLLVGAIVAIALVLGIIGVFVIPPSYTPEADIRGGFVFSNAVAKDADTRSGPYDRLRPDAGD